MSIEELRSDYNYATLSRADLCANPLSQLQVWLDEAQKQGIVDHHAFALATANTDAMPSVRTLLLRGISDRGVRFYSNAGSQKGQELASNPKAEMLFFWREMNRQIRIRGVVVCLPRQQAERYFHSRPLGSQQATYASEQSQPIDSRRQLDKQLQQVQQQYPEVVPTPEDWTGYELQPHYWEFWQGRQKRFHDRLCYQQQADGSWRIVRLQP